MVGMVYRQHKSPLVMASFSSTGFMCVRVGPRYNWWQRWDDVNLPYPRISQAKFRDETSRRGKSCNVRETLICKLVYLFIVFGEHGRYIGNKNHLW